MSLNRQDVCARRVGCMVPLSVALLKCLLIKKQVLHCFTGYQSVSTKVTIAQCLHVEISCINF